MSTEEAPREDAPEPPSAFIDKQEEAEAAFWRLKRAADKWRENRVKRVLAQEGESIIVTLGRVFYAVLCILFDGLVLVELPIIMGRTAVAWAFYLVLLVIVVRIQYDYYEKWFSVDITQIDFDQE
tara:strand:- start:1420 stop:1794 length:375 start_codon:yes stop_codon:yes gene_type:complete